MPDSVMVVTRKAMEDNPGQPKQLGSNVSNFASERGARVWGHLRQDLNSVLPMC